MGDFRNACVKLSVLAGAQRESLTKPYKYRLMSSNPSLKKKKAHLCSRMGFKVLLPYVSCESRKVGKKLAINQNFVE